MLYWVCSSGPAPRGEGSGGFSSFQKGSFHATDRDLRRRCSRDGGGLSLTELEPSFQFRGCPGLYFVGETLDCAGMCGGFNLHWAFGSGITAGRDAVRTLRRPHKKR